jgi:16S rRNA (guanine966-N2)-methyltransferase
MAEIRIVAGQWRGRRFKVPAEGVRPTADKVREAWMSIIQQKIPDARVLDLCAGSGALGLESLSRGAMSCDFVEKDPVVLRTLQENIALLGGTDRATVHRSDAVRFVEERTGEMAAGPAWDLAFADPPYRLGIAEALATRWLAAPFATIFGVEHESWITLPSPETGPPPDRRVYGETALTFYRLPT